jgi:site-specific DNA recombinase
MGIIARSVLWDARHELIELVLAGATNRYGHLLDKGVLYRLLNNRVYIGEAVHKGVSYPGEHQAIIDRKLFAEIIQV